MIIANLATYPPRRDSLLEVVKALAPQVDQLNVVLNQYSEVPAELAPFPNVNSILPHEDTKDVGKFYPDPSGRYTLLCDDDLIYPPEYVEKTIERFEDMPQDKVIGGYHCSLYRYPRPWPDMKAVKKFLSFRPRLIAEYRHVDVFYQRRGYYRIMDQVASGCCILRSEHMPPYEYMRDSQQFVDVRLGKWCFEQGILPVSMPREKYWINVVRYDETIFRDFTRTNPKHVSDEIWSFAFKVKGRGEKLQLTG